MGRILLWATSHLWAEVENCWWDRIKLLTAPWFQSGPCNIMSLTWALFWMITAIMRLNRAKKNIDHRPREILCRILGETAEMLFSKLLGVRRQKHWRHKGWASSFLFGTHCITKCIFKGTNIHIRIFQFANSQKYDDGRKGYYHYRVALGVGHEERKGHGVKENVHSRQELPHIMKGRYCLRSRVLRVWETVRLEAERSQLWEVCMDGIVKNQDTEERNEWGWKKETRVCEQK